MTGEKGITSAMAIVAIVVIVAVVAVGVYVVTIPGAGPAPTQTTTYTTTTTTSSPAPTNLKMGFITTSDETDLSWSWQAVRAAEYAKEKYGAVADVSRFGVIAVGDTPRVIEDFIGRGYNFIFTNGAEFSGFVLEPAIANPDVMFVAINPPFSEEETPPNVIGIYEYTAEAKYLAGILAGGMTQTKNIASIIGENYLPLHLEAISFEAGAKSVDPTIQVYTIYAGSWVDATLGYTLAKGMIEEHNVDVITGPADVTSRGVISAATEKNIWLIGVYADQSPLAPNNTLSSAMMDYSKLMDILMGIISTGKWDQYAGKIWELGIASGTGYLAPYGFFIDSSIPQDIKDKIETARQGIINGTLEIPSDPAYPGYPKLLPP